MNKVLIISPDPETTKILSLRLEIEGLKVYTALGLEDAKSYVQTGEPKVAVIDMVNFDEEEVKEISKIIKSLNQKKMCSFLLLPRVSRNTNIPRLPHTSLVIRKPYDLNVLVEEIQNTIKDQ